MSEIKIVFPLEVNNIEEAIKVLVDSSSAQNKEEVVEAVLEREKEASTYIGRRISVPHAKLKDFPKMEAIVAVAPSGIKHGDDISKIIILTLSSKKQSGPHIRFLSSIIRALEDDEIREAMENASSKEELEDILGNI